MNDSYLQLLINLGVDDATSRKNINDYIKSLKLSDTVKVTLEADGFKGTSNEIKDLQNQIKQLQSALNGLGGSSSGIDAFRKDVGKSVTSIEELERKVKEFNGTMSVSFDKDNAIKSVTAAFTDLDGKVQNIKFKPNFTDGIMDGLTEIEKKVSTVDFKDFDSKAEKTSSVLRDMARQGEVSADKLKDLENRLMDIMDNKSVSELERFNSELKELGKSASHVNKLDNAMSNIRNQTSEMVAKLSQLNMTEGIDKIDLNRTINELDRISKIDIDTSAQLKKVNEDFKKVEESVKSFIKEAERIDKVNVQISKLKDTIVLLQQQGKLSSDQAEGFLIDAQLIDKTSNAVQQLENQIKRTVDAGANMNKFEDGLGKVNKLLTEMERSGYVAEQRIEELKKELATIPKGNIQEINALLGRMKEELADAGRERTLTKNLDDLRERSHVLEAQMERTKNLFKGTFDSKSAETLAKAIKLLNEEIAKIEAKGINATNKELDQLNKLYKQANTQAQEFRANSTTAMRSSTGFIESFRTAMEKFPVWMAASSVFYGITRGVQDLTEKIIELDTALTSIQRVTSADNFELDGLIARANENVLELSGNMVDYLKLVEEFSRTGKTLNESFDLADTTMMLQNISDLDATEAVNALTAAMISYGIAAEDSVRIADSLNEVDNNYSISTQALAQSLMKSSATAKTFGVELNTLIGYTTA